MKLKCCYLTIFYQQVKKNATNGIFEPFTRRKGSKWETHFKRKI